MILESRLISEFQGEGYDEQVTLTYSATESTVLFRELSYLLISSFDNELQMNLNFGSRAFLPHAIRSCGNMLILIPRFYKLDSGRYPSRAMYLEITEYLSLSMPRILAFPKTDLIRLWSNLAYEFSELDQISQVSQCELAQIWLAFSGYQPDEPISPYQLDKHAEKVLACIVAEDSPLELSIKQIIPKIIHNGINYESSLLRSTVERFHLVYLLEDNSVREWKAMAIDGSSIYIVLDQYLLRIHLP